jgi:hypothetical protein
MTCPAAKRGVSSSFSNTAADPRPWRSSTHLDLEVEVGEGSDKVDVPAAFEPSSSSSPGEMYLGEMLQIPPRGSGSRLGFLLGIGAPSLGPRGAQGGGARNGFRHLRWLVPGATRRGDARILLRAPPVVVEPRRRGRTPAPTNVQRRLNLQCKFV